MFKSILRSAPVAAVLGLAASLSHAAVSADVTGAITAAQTDGTTIVGAMAVAGAGVYLTAKVLRKFGIML